MKKLALVLAILWGLLVWPEPARALEVVEAVITTQIFERSPVDAVEAYSASVGQLYCFTRFAGVAGETRVTHVWSREGQEMARVVLPLRNTNAQTWSSKRLLPNWTGAWQVEILDASGNRLKTLAFTLN